MDLMEAYNILGVNDSTPWPEIVKKFDHLYGVNERLGSFYLQSKIYRAKERLEMELKEEAERSAASAAREDEEEKKSGTGD